MPFAPAALHRAGGPVAVAMLRNHPGTASVWGKDGDARAIENPRTSPDQTNVIDVLVRRSQIQPHMRKPDQRRVERLLRSGLDRWHQIAKRHEDLVYHEYGVPTRPVVLGDPPHLRSGLPVVYENAPQSLRDIEEMIGVGIEEA